MKIIGTLVAAIAAASCCLGAANATTITMGTFNGVSNFNVSSVTSLAPPGEINIDFSFDAATP